MRCAICHKPEEEVSLYEGIFENELKRICSSCAEIEGIPIIRKPTQEQLTIADKRYSVRERMERMSSRSHPHPSEISRDQLIAHRNLNKLRVLPRKQTHPKLYDNYYWKISMARRRRKISIHQLAQSSGVSEEIIESIEKGNLPANFEQPMVKLEIALNLNLLRDHETKIRFNRPSKNSER